MRIYPLNWRDIYENISCEGIYMRIYPLKGYIWKYILWRDIYENISCVGDIYENISWIYPKTWRWASAGDTLQTSYTSCPIETPPFLPFLTPHSFYSPPLHLTLSSSHINDVLLTKIEIYLLCLFMRLNYFVFNSIKTHSSVFL